MVAVTVARCAPQVAWQMAGRGLHSETLTRTNFCQLPPASAAFLVSDVSSPRVVSGAGQALWLQLMATEPPKGTTATWGQARTVNVPRAAPVLSLIHI